MCVQSQLAVIGVSNVMDLPERVANRSVTGVSLINLVYSSSVALTLYSLML